jgi:hypothetical protein
MPLVPNDISKKALELIRGLGPDDPDPFLPSDYARMLGGRRAGKSMVQRQWLQDFGVDLTKHVFQPLLVENVLSVDEGGREYTIISVDEATSFDHTAIARIVREFTDFKPNSVWFTELPDPEDWYLKGWPYVEQAPVDLGPWPWPKAPPVPHVMGLDPEEINQAAFAAFRHLL